MPVEGVSLGACLSAIRAFLLRGGAAVEFVNLYANTRTLSCARGIIRSSGEDGSAPDPRAEAPHVCPVCQKPLMGSSCQRQWKLRQHFEKHRKDFQKRSLIKESLGHRIGSSQRESFQVNDERYVDNRSLVVQIISELEGVNWRGANFLQTGDNNAQHEGASVTAVPPIKEAADQAIIADVNALLTSDRARAYPGTLCIITDDGGFSHAIRCAREARWRVVVVGQRSVMRKKGDVGLKWDELMADAAAMPQSESGPRLFFRNRYD